MDPMLNRAELLRELDRSYSRFIAEIEKLKDDQLAIVGVTKLWSVRDLLAHMLFWHDRVERRAAGKPVEWGQGPGENREMYLARLNAKAVADMAHMSGRQTLLKFKASCARIVRLARTIGPSPMSSSRTGTSWSLSSETPTGITTSTSRASGSSLLSRRNRGGDAWDARLIRFSWLTLLIATF
jgi:hypothetical protein